LKQHISREAAEEMSEVLHGDKRRQRGEDFALSMN
jgi:hypothetical protein